MPAAPLMTSLPAVANSATPTSSAPTLLDVDSLIAEISSLYARIVAEAHDLRPRPALNALFHRLVALCVAPHDNATANALLASIPIRQLMPDLRRLCAVAEGELELHWARMFQSYNFGIRGPTIRNISLNAFPYFENYLNLTVLEVGNVLAFMPPQRRLRLDNTVNIAFIGSGPLPLTSFCLADLLSASMILNIDRDPEAIALSEQLARRLGYEESTMRFLVRDAAAHDLSGEMRNCDVVYVAALVGVDRAGKEVVLRNVVAAMRHGALLVVRSARGARTVLYPEVVYDAALKAMGLDLLVEVHPWNDIVNSTLVLQVRKPDNGP